mgnify:FL=1
MAGAMLFLCMLMACEGEQQQNVDWVSVDDEKIMDYLAENNISAEKHPSGIYYRITKQGNGQHPNSTNIVVANYTGYLLDGTVFDQGTGAEFPLTNVIQGWQIGIPLLSKGGSGQLFIPSYLAYGSRPPTSAIPRNSVLIFDVELLNF